MILRETRFECRRLSIGGRGITRSGRMATINTPSPGPSNARSGMKEAGSKSAMMCRRMMLGKIVGVVIDATTPKNNEVTLFDSIPKPIEAHVHSFGTALSDRFVGYAGSTGVVGLNRRCWLWVAEIV